MKSFLECMLLLLVMACVMSTPLKKEEEKHRREVTYVANTYGKMILGFSWAVTKVIGMSANPLAGVAATGITKFTDILVQMAFQTKKKSIWASIEDRLTHKIDDRITHNHFGALVSRVYTLEGFMQQGHKLTKKDMDVHILPMKFDFLPQTFAFTSFNSKWMTALPAYLTYMVAAYMELIRSGEIEDECALAKQLHVIRKETIQAAKALARARYKRIVGTEDFTKRPPGCSGLVGCNAQYLTFKDLTTGVSAGWAIDDVHSGVIWPAENDAAKRIMEQLVSKVNPFFNKTDVFCAKDYPNPIRWSEIKFRYPHECFGHAKDGRLCTLPCHYYSESEPWCPLFLYHHIPRNSLLRDDWEWCKKEDKDFLKCMPVEGTTVFE